MGRFFNKFLLGSRKEESENISKTADVATSEKGDDVLVGNDENKFQLVFSKKINKKKQKKYEREHIATRER